MTPAPARAALVAAVGALLAGCAGSGPSRAALEPAVATAYAHLYVRQQTLLDRTGFDERTVAATASCDRGGPAVPDRGAGDDWVCSVAFAGVDGPPARVTYELTVGADGCYRADGPPAVVGQQQLRLPDGSSTLNPLYAFDGCTRP